MNANRFYKITKDCDLKGVGLEIGAAHSPICSKKDGYNIKILDRLNREELLEIYKNNPSISDRKLRNIEEVDYIWHGEDYTELIHEKNHFDYILASHVIEHVPDLITFLQQCSEILKEGGRLSLVIPDKRECFDCFRSLTSLGQIIDAYEEKRKQPTLGTVTEEMLYGVSKDNRGGWNRIISNLYPDYTFTFEEKRYGRVASNIKRGIYANSHIWVFTPASFRMLIQDLNDLGYIQLKEVSFSITENDSHEFYATYEKTTVREAAFNMEKRKRLMFDLKQEQEELFDNNHYKSKVISFCSKYKNIYIYGTGNMGKVVQFFLKENDIGVKGFIVSDNYYEFGNGGGEINNIPCFKISEMDKINGSGVIVAMNYLNTLEVKPILRNKNINNIFYLCES